jgi:hypothetical protein
MLDLVVTRSEEHDPNPAELLDEVLGAKIGLALSGFGTLVWGWGAYLQWWSFLYLAFWGLFAIRRIYRDNHRLKRSDTA